MNRVINRSKFRIGFHINKKYNFVKGLTVSQILVYTWIGILALTATFGIIAVFATAITKSLFIFFTTCFVTFNFFK